MVRQILIRLKGKTPQLLLLLVIAVPIAIVLLDTMEDTLIEGGAFPGTPLDVLLNGIVLLTQNATATVSSWGYAGVFLLMLLESSSLPIPSEVILPFSGYLVSLNQLNMWITVLVSTIAGMVGSLIDYYIGMKGADMLARRKILERVFLDKGRLEVVKAWFDRYGVAAVFLSRMIPGFRTLVSFPAGATKMPLTKFAAYTVAGCLIWNAFLIYIGFYVGANWREVAGVSRYLIVGILVVIIVTSFVLLARRRPRTVERVDESGEYREKRG